MAETETPTLGRIRAAWVATDDSNERLANVGMDPRRFRAIFHGTRNPSSLDLALMAEAFRVTVDWLLGGRKHVPVMVYDRNDPERIAPPSEVCDACSDIEAGKLVPATFCEEAKAQLGPAPWED